MENLNNINIPQQQQEESVDIRAIFFKFVRFWYLFAISIFVAIVVAFLFNKYTAPIYESTTSILVKDDKSALDPSSLIGIGLSNNQQNVENEIGKLTSFTLSYRTIKKLDFEVSYFVEDGLIKKELYHEAPFNIVFDSTVPQAVSLIYSMRVLNKNEYLLEADAELIEKYLFSESKLLKDSTYDKIEINEKHRFGELVDNGYNTFKVILNDKFDPEEDFDRTYAFVFNDYFSLTKLYRGFDIEPINREASILKITLKGKNVGKDVNFLNMLTHEYLAQSLEKKNRIADNTIKFIDQQLGLISDSLRVAELNLQKFRSSNEVMDMSFQSQQLFEYLNDLEKQKAELMVKSQYYKNLENYILKNKDNYDQLVAPSAMGIEDPVLNQLVAQLIELYNKKSDALLASTERSPAVISLNNQIRSTKNAILENIKNIIYNSNEALSDIQVRIDDLTKQASTLPVTERELFNYQRQFELSNNIYTYLMEKRAEAQITKASNMPDNEVIDIARKELSEQEQVFPKKGLNYLIALILGLIIPVVYVLGRDYLNDKVIEKKDIESVTNFPIIGQLLHSDKETQLVVAESPKSSIAESYRSLRTNIQFLVKGQEKTTLLVTADMVSAGKTFVSMNLATVYAQYGRKTILLGFDLRKPKIYQDFKLSNNLGLTSYLINKATLDEIIQPSQKIPNMDIILSGPVPPNPAELIASEKTTELFRELRERYDYIIIDTPPVGLVTDAYLLMEHADINIYLVRQNLTNKKVFASIIQDIEERGLKMYIVVNDINLSGGYGYGYGYGYYTDDKPTKKKSFFRRLFNKI